MDEPIHPETGHELHISQRYIDALVSRGILFSIVWLLGIGSVLALLRGLEARKLIEASHGKLTGMRGAWWCIIVGAIGTIVWTPIVVAGIVGVLMRR